MLTGFQNRSPPRRNVDQHPPTCPKVGFSSLGRPAVGGPREGKKALPIDLAARRGEWQRTATLSEMGSAAGTPTRAAAPHPTGGDYMDCVRVTDPDAIPATHHHERHSTVPGSGAAISEHLQASTTVVTGTSSRLAIARQLNPSLRSRIASSRRNTRRGRPRVLPFALAARTPATVLSRIISFSSSANALMMVNMNRAIGLLSSVPMFWVTARNLTPNASNS